MCPYGAVIIDRPCQVLRTRFALLWKGETVVAGVVGTLFGWPVLGYLVWRALPAVRADLSRLGGRLSGRPGGRFTRRRSK